MNLFSPIDSFFTAWRISLPTAFLYFFGLKHWQLSNSNHIFKTLKSAVILNLSSNGKFFILKNSENMIVISALFVFVLNFLGVIPYNFPWSTQISWILRVTLIMWGSVISCKFALCLPSFVSHLVPQGSPLRMSPFIVLIELVSFLIRPITLIIRLVANITAGHVLLGLARIAVNAFSPAFRVYTLLSCVELFVSLVQRYIYFTLLTLYMSE